MNSTGTPLTDLAAFRVYYATSSSPCPGSSAIQVPALTSSPTANQMATMRLTGLSPGTLYYVPFTAVEATVSKSACSTVASGIARSEFTVSPTGTVNFGAMSVGSFADRTFTVQNTGAGQFPGPCPSRDPSALCPAVR